MEAAMAHPRQSSTGVLYALCSIFIVQIGAAASTPVFAQVGPAGTAWLRLCWAGVIFLLVARPNLAALHRRDLAAAVLLGIVSAGLTTTFFEAIDRIPLATAVAIEFLGPLTVAVLRRSSRWGLVWPPLAFAGVLLVTQPWSGLTDPVGIGFALAAGACWGAYILLTQRIGQRFHGLAGLAVSMPAAALAATPVGLYQALGHLTPGVVAACLGLALFVPVIPYSLELLALRRLDAGTFGTLMAVEPAAALVVGVVMLRQLPGWGQTLGIALVTVAAIGAARTGRSVEVAEAASIPAPG
jgi:inner membrane transporter RhtA